MTLHQGKSILLKFNLQSGFHIECNLNFMDFGLTGTDLFISSKDKKQQGQYKLIIFFFSEGVSISST